MPSPSAKTIEVNSITTSYGYMTTLTTTTHMRCGPSSNLTLIYLFILPHF